MEMFPDWGTLRERALEGVVDAELRSIQIHRLQELETLGITTLHALTRALESRDLPTSALADCCWLAGLASHNAVVGHIIALLSESEEQALIWEAAKALSVMKLAKSQVLHLIRTLELHPGPENRSACAYVLGFDGSQEAVLALVRCLSNSAEKPNVRGQAAEALGETNSAVAVEPLIESLSSPVVEVRFWAAFALGKLKNPAGRDALMRALADQAVLEGWGSVADEARSALAELDCNEKID